MHWKELESFLSAEPIMNSHSHHLPDRAQHELTLETVLHNSYVSWCGKGIPAFGSAQDRTAWLQVIRTRSYFVWLEKALMQLYGLDEPLQTNTWEQYDRAIRTAHQNPDWHLQLLRQNCRYQSILLDAYWAPGDNNGHPDLFTPVYRVNSFFYGYHPSAMDHNGNNIQKMYQRQIQDIDEYQGFVRQILEEKKRSGYKILKCALAYDRSMLFGEATREQAQKGLQENASSQDIVFFQDYVMNTLCDEAARLGFALQIHTGLGQLVESEAMRLRPLIANYPDVTFLLMHGSYPWTSDIAALTHYFPNVWADICWLPIISSAAAKRLLDELIDVCDADRIVWGCDTWTSEESYGARMAFFHVLSRVLSERMNQGLMRQEDALRYARAILHDNLARLL